MVNTRELTEDGLEKNFATNTLGEYWRFTSGTYLFCLQKCVFIAGFVRCVPHLKGHCVWTVWQWCKRDKWWEAGQEGKWRCGGAGKMVSQVEGFPTEVVERRGEQTAREKSCLTLLISVRMKAAPLAKRHLVLASVQQSWHSSPSASVQGRWISQETVFNIFKSTTLGKNCGALFLCFPPVHQYLEWGGGEPSL